MTNLKHELDFIFLHNFRAGGVFVPKVSIVILLLLIQPVLQVMISNSDHF